MEQGGGGAGTEAGGQKFLPPNPLPFCPPAWASLLKFFGGRTAGPQISSGRVRFQKLFPAFHLLKM